MIASVPAAVIGVLVVVAGVLALVGIVLVVVSCLLVVFTTVFVIADIVLVVVVVDSEVNSVVSRVVKCDIDDIVVGVSVSEFVELHVLVSEVEK